MVQSDVLFCLDWHPWKFNPPKKKKRWEYRPSLALPNGAPLLHPQILPRWSIPLESFNRSAGCCPAQKPTSTTTFTSNYRWETPTSSLFSSQCRLMWDLSSHSEPWHSHHALKKGGNSCLKSCTTRRRHLLELKTSDQRVPTKQQKQKHKKPCSGASYLCKPPGL